MIASIAEEIMDGYHEYKTDEGEFYGVFRDKKPNGLGKIVVPIGFFTGIFKDGLPGGEGTLQMATRASPWVSSIEGDVMDICICQY